MVQVFISYSRVDTPFVEQLYRMLQRMRPRWRIWYDQAPHGLLGGDSWWDEIMTAIADSDIFIYVLTNESVQSKYCQAEFEEARRLQKRIITIQARDRTKMTGNLSEIHFVDMKDGVTDGEALASLGGALDRQAALIKKRRALWRPQTPKPEDEPTPAPRPADAPDIDTPTLTIPVPTSGIEPDNNRRNWTLYAAIASVVVVLLIGGLIALNGGGDADDITPTDAQGAIAGINTETPTDEPTALETLTPSPTDEPTSTPTATDTAMPTETPTDEPTPDIIAAAQLVIQQQTAQAIIDAETATAARATQDYELQMTEDANQTATATLWTNTPTPDITASIEAILTEWAEQTATHDAANLTATATLWTVTPTNTDTPTATATPTNTPTFTPTPDATATLIAFRPQTNDDWTPIEREFDGMEMVLVPAGCFMMGNDPQAQYWDGSRWATGVPDGGEQCFDDPFWIGQTEVTNAQYAEFIDAGGYDNPDYWTDAGWSARQSNGWTQPGRWTDSDFNGANQPVVSVSWYEAMAYAEWRGCRLPTEAEWEYAARGPDGLIYPWGDEFVADNLVYRENSNNRTANVGSRPGGVSWVGALDMAGNVWNWTLSEFADYPYSADDGRENVSSSAARVVRGGSFFNFNSLARAASRNHSQPDNRNYAFNGLRLVCVPSSL